MEPIDERELAQQLRAGNRLAWLAVYDRFAEEVWCYVARHLPGDREAVGDTVQETFLAAAGRARYYDSTWGPLRAWLFGIARRHIAYHYRRTAGVRGRLRLLFARLTFDGRSTEPVAGQDGEPDSHLESSENAERVRAALLLVPPEQRLALIEICVEGRSTEETAALMSRSPGAVRSLLARGRRSFRVAFAGAGRDVALPGECSNVTDARK